MTTLHLSGMGPLLALMPYEFGFAPTASLVVTFMDGGRVAGAARFDEAVVTPEHVHHVRDRVVEASNRLGTSGVVVTAYQCSPGVDLDLVTRALAPAVEVEHALVVAPDVWWATTCTKGCCDGALAPVPTAADVPSLASALEARLEPASSRDEAVAALHAVSPLAQRAVADLLVGLPGETGRVRAAWREVASGSGHPHSTREREALALVVDAMPDPLLRDEMVWSVVPELAAGARTTRQCWSEPVSSQRLLEILVAVPEPARAHWLCLVALARWREGERPSAVLAAAEAQERGARLPLVDLVVRMTSSGMAYEDFLRPARPNRAARRRR